ncbi:hypothetical protein B0H16DRAFT_1791586 [Mycena metata]|uniref:Uncharacterized protein n=1 Tax=Mycena metata TaxID=1033252 RepID=A0AAD7ML55_9AGAR|nr:hypothetical protein B0H16DRAFT_1791586 [Mycena metata]
MSDRELYSRLLLATGNGYPLSYPQPSDDLPPECQARGLEIGDVGALSSDGSFNVFFNICRPHDDPANRFGVPVGFERIDLGSNPYVSQKTYHRSGSHVSNTKMNVRRLDLDAQVDNVFSPLSAAVIELSTTSTQTAVLLLPDGGSRLDLRFLDTFRDLAIKHAQGWYAFVTGLGTMIENGDLYLITGVNKSISWGVAAERSHTEDGGISLKLSAAQVGSAGGSHAWSWEVNSTFADMGPRRPPGEAQSTENQTVFLRGYRIAIPLGKKPSQVALFPDSKPATFFRWLKSFGWSTTPTAAVEPPRDDGSTPHNDDGSTFRAKRMVTVEHSPTTRPFHPVDAINKHILESFPEASAVVIHDDEWTSVLEQDEEAIPDESELTRRIFARYETMSMLGGVCLRDKPRSPPTQSVASKDTELSARNDTVITGNELLGGGHGGRGVTGGRATGQGRSPADDTGNGMMISNGLKFWGGGFGGHGGAAGVTGGRGGEGKGPRLTPETALSYEGNIVGGFGGTGGWGVYTGGIGGVGERLDLTLQPLFAGDADDVEETAVDMPLEEFCQAYKIGQDLLARLKQEGFTSAGAFLEITNGQLEDKGFGLGHIAELKRALRQYGARNRVQK